MSDPITLSDQPPTDQFRAAADVLRRRWWVVALCALALPSAALAASLTQQKRYTGKALLLFRDPAFDQKLFGTTFLAESRDPDREAATNVRLVALRPVVQRTAERIGGLDADAIERKVEVEAEGQSDIVSVTATDPSPRRAASLANVFATEYIRVRRMADQSTIRGAQQLVERRLSSLPRAESSDQQARRALQQRAEELDILASLQTGDAELAEYAEVPDAPSSPRVERNVAVGAVLGLLLGGGLAFLLDRLDRRLRDVEEVEQIFGRPVLGVLPQLRGGDPSPQDLLGGQGEATRMLRANLKYFNVNRETKRVLVTSAAPGEGKSTICRTLALTAALSGDRVLLIEADLRRPTLVERFGRSNRSEGLSTLLSQDRTLDDIVDRIPLELAGAPPTHRGGLEVLFAGPLPPNPLDLLESGRMKDLVRKGTSLYDLVLLDTPPVSLVSDAVPLIQFADGVIVVTRLGSSTKDGARGLREKLERLDAPLLGIVANYSSTRGDTYGYGYYAAHTRDGSTHEALADRVTDSA